METRRFQMCFSPATFLTLNFGLDIAAFCFAFLTIESMYRPKPGVIFLIYILGAQIIEIMLKKGLKAVANQTVLLVSEEGLCVKNEITQVIIFDLPFEYLDVVFAQRFVFSPVVYIRSKYHKSFRFSVLNMAIAEDICKTILLYKEKL